MQRPSSSLAGRTRSTKRARRSCRRASSSTSKVHFAGECGCDSKRSLSGFRLAPRALLQGQHVQKSKHGRRSHLSSSTSAVWVQA